MITFLISITFGAGIIYAWYVFNNTTRIRSKKDSIKGILFESSAFILAITALTVTLGYIGYLRLEMPLFYWDVLTLVTIAIACIHHIFMSLYHSVSMVSFYLAVRRANKAFDGSIVYKPILNEAIFLSHLTSRNIGACFPFNMDTAYEVNFNVLRGLNKTKVNSLRMDINKDTHEKGIYFTMRDRENFIPYPFVLALTEHDMNDRQFKYMQYVNGLKELYEQDLID